MNRESGEYIMNSAQKIFILIISVILLPCTFSSAAGADGNLQTTVWTNNAVAPYFDEAQNAVAATYRDGAPRVFGITHQSGGNAPHVGENGRVDGRPDAYGKFGFIRVPEEGRLYDTVNGNCLSYALRDSVPVHLEDLGGSYDDINRVYLESGKDGVVVYIGGLFEKYVEEHKMGLCISNLRRIDDFDSPVDPSEEYRIALRVGCYPEEDRLLSAEADNFDYHFQAQLDDGRWSQKFEGDYSEIIPATSAGMSPGKYEWDMAKYGYTYNSKIIYYAVTKNTDEITVHRPSPFDDVDLYTYINNGIECVFSKGLITGTSAEPMLFNPDTELTRGMAATVFYRMAGSPDMSGYASLFNDVSVDKWYCDAVKWAAANSIMNGVGNGNFSPELNITREETAVAFLNYQKFTGVILPDILLGLEPEDEAEISIWAREAAIKLMMQMIFIDTDGNFIPKGEVTRIEFAGMLRDYFEKSKDVPV